ncbi:MAG TPA: TonB-dependent receptor [Steroidobacteraceae bacterium]|nr:TonB-dependent receptor [Steroidobacteraceae bacterium]
MKHRILDRAVARRIGVAASLGWLLAAGVAAAQTGTADSSSGKSADVLQQIVVTAERRRERLMDVPMSVTAFGRQALERQQLHNIDDLTRVAPGVTFLRNGNSVAGNYNDEGSDISIRGIDSTAGASTTGIYIDDTPIQTRHLNFGTVNPFPSLFDLERVEVLKGPQGTLFGAGSEGGTIRFITPEPGLHRYSGFARADVGQIDGGGQSYEAGAAFGGPIIDGRLGFRVSASFRRDGGWVDRVAYTPPPSTLVNCTPCFGAGLATVYSGVPTINRVTEANANWQDTDTFRAALKWQPTDDFSLSPSFYVQTLHINDTGVYWLNLSNPSRNVYNDGNLQRNPSTDPWYIGAIKAEWTLPGVQLTSNTSYFSRAQHSVSDYSQWAPTIFLYNQYTSPTDTSSAYFTDRQDNFTQEFRASSANSASRLQWTAGLYYAHVHENSTEHVYSADIGGATPANAYLQPLFGMIDKQLALFGEMSYKIVPTVKATVGLRYSRLNYSGAINESGVLVLNSNIVSSNSGSDNPVTPRFVLAYQPTADSLYYVSAAKGFRPGGINASLPANCTSGLPEQPPTFASDSLWQYELGSKNTLFNNRVQVSAAVYYLKWNNIQQFVYLTCGLGFDYNLGSVTGKGGDFAISWRLSDNVTAALTGAYTDSAYSTNVSLGGVYPLVTAGDHLPSSPWNVTANVAYVWPELPHRPYLRVDYQYSTAQHSLVPYQDPSNAPNDDPTQPGLPTVSVLNLRSGLHFGALDVSLWVQNLLNFHTPIFVSRDLATTPLNGFPPNFDTNYFARGYAPRTYGVTTTYRF